MAAARNAPAVPTAAGRKPPMAAERKPPPLGIAAKLPPPAIGAARKPAPPPIGAARKPPPRPIAAPRKPPPPPIAAPRKPPPPPIVAPRKPPPPPIAAPPAKPPPRPPPNPRCADAMSGTSIATAAVAINAITVLRNMTVLPHPVAPEQDDAFVAKALQVRSRKPAGCDKIAHQSKPLQSAAAANAIYVAIDRPVFLFDHGIAVCCGLVASAPRRRVRGTGRDAGLRFRRGWCRAAAMQASRNCRRPPVRRTYRHASPRKNCPNIWASSFMLDYADETR